MKAAPAPWRMEPVHEGHAAVLGHNGVLVCVTTESNARLMVEGVNERMRVEQIVYSFRSFDWDTEAIARGAYMDDTL